MSCHIIILLWIFLKFHQRTFRLNPHCVKAKGLFLIRLDRWSHKWQLCLCHGSLWPLNGALVKYYPRLWPLKMWQEEKQYLCNELKDFIDYLKHQKLEISSDPILNSSVSLKNSTFAYSKLCSPDRVGSTLHMQGWHQSAALWRRSRGSLHAQCFHSSSCTDATGKTSLRTLTLTRTRNTADWPQPHDHVTRSLLSTSVLAGESSSSCRTL